MFRLCRNIYFMKYFKTEIKMLCTCTLKGLCPDMNIF